MTRGMGILPMCGMGVSPMRPAGVSPARVAGILPAPRSVLLIKPSSLGDVVSAVPVLGGLKRTFPDARVTWLATPACAGILACRPDLDEVLLFDRRRFGHMSTSPAALAAFIRFCRALRRRRFDWVIDLQGLFRSTFLAWAARAPVRAGFAAAREGAWLFYNRRIAAAAQHTIDRNIELARQLGLDARPEDLRLIPAPAGEEYARALMARTGLAPRRYVVAVVGARWRNKLWPIRFWRELARRLRPTPLVAVGSSDEADLCAELAAEDNVVNLGGQTDLVQLVSVIAAAGAVVCGDSAAAFIAPAVCTPFVMLIGPTRAERTGPYGRLGRAVVADVACQGCLRRACAHATCMQVISAGSVYAALRAAMQDRPEEAI